MFLSGSKGEVGGDIQVKGKDALAFGVSVSLGLGDGKTWLRIFGSKPSAH